MGMRGRESMNDGRNAVRQSITEAIRDCEAQLRVSSQQSPDWDLVEDLVWRRISPLLQGAPAPVTVEERKALAAMAKELGEAAFNGTKTGRPDYVKAVDCATLLRWYKTVAALAAAYDALGLTGTEEAPDSQETITLPAAVVREYRDATKGAKSIKVPAGGPEPGTPKAKAISRLIRASRALDDAVTTALTPAPPPQVMGVGVDMAKGADTTVMEEWVRVEDVFRLLDGLEKRAQAEITEPLGAMWAIMRVRNALTAPQQAPATANEPAEPAKMADDRWNAAIRHARRSLPEYRKIPTGFFAATLIAHAITRFEAGERTQELLEELEGIK